MKFPDVLENLTPAVFMFLLVFISSAHGKEQNIDSYWGGGLIVTDGQFNDWVDVPVTFFKDEKVSVGVANDSAHLYILFRFTDRQWARLIRMGGLSVWVDNQAKKKKDFGLKFSGGPKFDSAQMAPRKSTPESQRLRDDRRGEIPENQLLVIDKARLVEKIIPMDGSEGPQISCGMTQDFYTYEFKIPLKKSELNCYGAGVAAGDKISIGLIWGDMEQFKGRRAEGGGPVSGGIGDGPMGGGPPPGGMPGGGPGGGRMQMPEKQEIWLKTKLSVSSAAQTAPNP